MRVLLGLLPLLLLRAAGAQLQASAAASVPPACAHLVLSRPGAVAARPRPATHCQLPWQRHHSHTRAVVCSFVVLHL